MIASIKNKSSTYRTRVKGIQKKREWNHHHHHYYHHPPPRDHPQFVILISANNQTYVILMTCSLMNIDQKHWGIQ